MTAAKVLAYTLIVRHPDSDVPTAVLAGKPVPKWAKDLIHDDDLAAGSGGDQDDDDTGADAVDPTDLAASTVPKLRDFAKEQGIDLGDATKKPDVVAAIQAELANRAAANGA